jgi:serine/threonine protein kinase/Flp pilus assembly protein TadD
MTVDFARLQQVFHNAVEQHSPDEWDAYLDQACAGDQDLRRQAAMLLKAHAEGRSLLGAAPEKDRTQAYEATECPGMAIGPYKLLEQIGEGGFGVVFLAEQQEPIRRKVALKVIKPGMDTRQVIARFEAERQALALMDHANIARVLDAGTTEPAAQARADAEPLACAAGSGGRPYFVMELVRGPAMTDYCDQNNLPIRERLELFIDVCQAVQHAHQKGIIHRDIKPSNVLVTLHDGKPVLKVIDFGIAKALRQQLTDKTLFTNFAQMIGTPLYMSPEQAEWSGLDVDTRSDIYSLGVLLYELLTGTTPFDKERLKQASFDEIRRIIREEEPPKPSTRMSTIGQAATTASEKRQSDPRKLSRLFRGELDWIVMQALEKDRNRRYETASAFVVDVQRYLKVEAVQACPPSAWYRFRKFARRNRGVLTTAAVISATLVLAVVALAISTAMIWWDKEEKEAARAAAANNQKKAEHEADEARKAQLKADANLEWALKITGDHGNLAGTVRDAGRPAQAVQAWRDVVGFWEKLVADFPDKIDYQRQLASWYWTLANALQESGQLREAADVYRKSVDGFSKLVPARPFTKADETEGYVEWCSIVLLEMGDTLRAAARYPEAEDAYRRCLSLREQIDRDVHGKSLGWDEAQVHTRLATLLEEDGHPDVAETTYRRALDLLAKEDPRRFGPGILDKEMALANSGLGNLLSALGRTEEAGKFHRQALTVLRNPSVDGWRSLAWFLATCPDSELRDLPEALRIAKLHVIDSPRERDWRTLGLAHYRTEDWKEAVKTLEKSEQLHRSNQHGSQGASLTLFVLAMAHWQAGDKEQARRSYQVAVELMEKNNPRDGEVCRFRAEAAELLGMNEKKN